MKKRGINIWLAIAIIILAVLALIFALVQRGYAQEPTATWSWCTPTPGTPQPTWPGPRTITPTFAKVTLTPPVCQTCTPPPPTDTQPPTATATPEIPTDTPTGIPPVPPSETPTQPGVTPSGTPPRITPSATPTGGVYPPQPPITDTPTATPTLPPGVTPSPTPTLPPGTDAPPGDKPPVLPAAGEWGADNFGLLFGAALLVGLVVLFWIAKARQR